MERKTNYNPWLMFLYKCNCWGEFINQHLAITFSELSKQRTSPSEVETHLDSAWCWRRTAGWSTSGSLSEYETHRLWFLLIVTSVQSQDPDQMAEIHQANLSWSFSSSSEFPPQDAGGVSEQIVQTLRRLSTLARRMAPLSVGVLNIRMLSSTLTCTGHHKQTQDAVKS